MNNESNSPYLQTPPSIPQEAFDWYDEYAHGVIDRREFIKRLSGLAVFGFSVSMITSALLPDYAQAEQVSFNDPAIKASYVEFDSPQGHGKGRGYWVTPKEATGKLPVVLVIHENRGLNPYIEDVARRLATIGFIAFAPDALFPVGGYPGNDDDGRALQSKLDRARIEADFLAAADFLKAHPQSSGKLGAVGFCFGGYIVNMLAATIPEKLNAGVVFYGTPPADELRSRVVGPLLLNFAELDKRVNDTWASYETQLQQNKAKYEAHFYPKVNHGFHNDSTARYAPAEAELAWQRTLQFLGLHLQG
ncbi:dienelactone hydrolase family protein [Vibrio tarriae]|uniref:Dienelactone hydrolase n=1 Tax=Vibrio tarriae TaxID=2014742 RepID=A0AAU8WW81_9VIBR|nr:dienelactone hydrolase family protein [Vibrio tarriae]ASK56080.1 dienelactone hydrolase [Vibrio tarriae]RBM26459.1 dienelactone hydrolase family protein [Vibrio tarriae]RBM35161.1 dienelactone hydrolase family protein [Vibrio tarriae]RBM54412.1 dienelactone hydrolase family protein [Vibrio tarriae]RBM71315.1 dienelactone hydrolase family protein [Vibrio tarriae]